MWPPVCSNMNSKKALFFTIFKHYGHRKHRSHLYHSLRRKKNLFICWYRIPHEKDSSVRIVLTKNWGNRTYVLECVCVCDIWGTPLSSFYFNRTFDFWYQNSKIERRLSEKKHFTGNSNIHSRVEKRTNFGQNIIKVSKRIKRKRQRYLKFNCKQIHWVARKNPRPI